ncbi:P-loop containing nucleoside triphosphate hydrolase protein [Aspergillus spinulosporus]
MPSSSLTIRSLTPVGNAEMDPSFPTTEITSPKLEEASAASISSESLNNLTQSMTNLVKKIKNLRHLGIEDSHITLPKICVIGDQSTGKSSLIEGMSEIKVPRSSGTCTRCPMEINLSDSKRGEPWTCRVYLSRKYMYDGSGKMTKPKKNQPLGPWLPMEQEDEHFITITDKTQTAEAIKCAQLAILNPGSTPANYLPSMTGETDPQDCEVKFSPNIIRLDISAHGFPNLSFYDLPGVINQVESDKESYLVKLVENLVKDYISQDNCIILLTIPMTDDVMNSSAARIMNDIRGAKKRALGVLTKPDRVQAGDSYTQWIEILEGVKFRLEHDYYVVRNNPDPSVEHSVARKEEDDFFTSPPWTALSKLLFQQIQGCLPLIIEEINKRAYRIDEELSKLPAPPSANVPYILCKKLHTFEERIHCQIDGGSREYPLQKIWNNIAEDFKRALAKTRPTVKLLADLDKQKIAITRDEDDSECEVVQYSVKRKLPGDSIGNWSPGVRNGTKNPSKYHTAHFEKFSGPAREFTWEAIREINKDSASAGIPQQLNPRAIDYMNKISVAHWREPMVTFINASHQLVKDKLLHELNGVFVQYTQTGLFRELERIIKNYLRKLHVEHLAHVDELYEIEHCRPFTMAYSQLNQATEDCQKQLQSKRLAARANHYLDLQGKFPRDDPRRENERKKLGVAELGPDDFALEVRMMATTRGYYEVASSRFVDSVCQTVHTKLFMKCRENLVKTIENELGIGDENGMPFPPSVALLLTLYLSAVGRCNELMSEDVERQRRREYFERQKEKVMKAQEWLNAENGTTDGEDELMGDYEPAVKTELPDTY